MGIGPIQSRLVGATESRFLFCSNAFEVYEMDGLFRARRVTPLPPLGENRRTVMAGKVEALLLNATPTQHSLPFIEMAWPN